MFKGKFDKDGKDFGKDKGMFGKDIGKDVMKGKNKDMKGGGMRDSKGKGKTMDKDTFEWMMWLKGQGKHQSPPRVKDTVKNFENLSFDGGDAGDIEEDGELEEESDAQIRFQ